MRSRRRCAAPATTSRPRRPARTRSIQASASGRPKASSSTSSCPARAASRSAASSASGSDAAGARPLRRRRRAGEGRGSRRGRRRLRHEAVRNGRAARPAARGAPARGPGRAAARGRRARDRSREAGRSAGTASSSSSRRTSSGSSACSRPNEGKLLTHRTILREVWGAAYQTESHYLHVYVSQLRQQDRATTRHALATCSRRPAPATGSSTRNLESGPEARRPSLRAWPQRQLALKRTLIGRPRASGRAARDAALEAARASDLRVRPALLGGVRDRGGARRPDRRLGDRRPSRPADLDRDRGGDGDRRPLVHADGQGVRDERRRLRRCAGEPRQDAEPRRRGGAARRLHPHRRRLGRRRRPRPHVGRALARAATRSTLSLAFIVLLTVVNLRGVRESGVLFAVPTYAFVAAMYAMVGTGVGKCAVGECPVAHAPDPVAAGAGVVGAVRPAPGLRLRRCRAHRGRGDLERRQRLPAAHRAQRGPDAARDGRDRDQPLRRRLLPRGRTCTPTRARASRSSPRSPAATFPRLPSRRRCTSPSRR